MAKMYPAHLSPEIRSDPRRRGELSTYEALAATLGDGYSVFYSVPWRGTTGDRQVRDGEADFLVLHPEQGLLVIEVKGGLISHDAASGRWHSTSAAGRLHQIKDPYQQAQTSKYNLLSLLRELPELRGVFLPAAHAVVFPDVAALSGSLGPGLGPITAMAPDLYRLGDWVEQVFSSVAPRPGFRLSPAERHQVEQFLGRELRLTVTAAVGAARAEQQIIQLSERQRDFLRLLRGHRRVEISGGAGTGKTVLASEAARRLLAEGRRICLVCFNRPLRDRLEGELGDLPGLEVMTFHGLCRTLAREADLPLPTLPRGFDLLPDLALLALDCLPDRRWDGLVVDEAQDLKESWWDLLQLMLAHPDRDPIFSFRDDNQRLYQTTGGPAEMERFLLDTNLRNTRQIHELASGLYRGGDYRSSGVSGPRPLLREVSGGDWAGPLAETLGELRREGFGTDQVVVLTASGRRRSELPVGELCGEARLSWLGESGPGDIRCETVRRFKGLESPVVVLTELGGMLGRAATTELAYVALSRARAYLVVLGTAPELAALHELLGHGYS